jgi:ribonuclease HI
LENKNFPSNYDKAEAFVDLFSNNSLTSSLSENNKSQRHIEEEKDVYNKSINMNNDVYINADITFNEFLQALNSFSNNKSAVGLDGISYQLLCHLPLTWLELLHSFFHYCWNKGTIPSFWKQSVVVPIHKQGKPKSVVGSYRPIALTSNVSKLFEKIILQRLNYYCEKNNILPKEQAGFRKGRCTLDHLVKLSSQIKKQFAHRKSILATFFDVKRAYDSVWHKRLLYKVRQIGIDGKMLSYLSSFISGRQICTRVGKTYSAFKGIDMGIPQGSVISPILFSILIYDLPTVLSKSTQVVQYADDIAIWIKTKIRKNTNKRIINYIKVIFQNELNNLSKFMRSNGLEFSAEKTCLMLFNNGESPKSLPEFSLDGQILQYQKQVKFLGIIFTPKLNWRIHIENLISKVQKRLNFLKIVNRQAWAQDTKTLIHLATSLVRSKISYGQEVYFSASNYLLNKLQSLDCKAIKIALGVPVHSNSSRCYQEAGVLPLSVYRKLASAKYVSRCLTVSNSVRDEILIDTIIDYPKRARAIPYLQPIRNYTSDLFDGCNFDIIDIQQVPMIPVMPQWEYLDADFDYNYTSYNKSEEVHLLVNEVKERIEYKYCHYLKVYTDGSVLENGYCGSAYVIPSMKVHKSFHIGKGFSIYTAELFAILKSLEFISNCNYGFYSILFCVDSLSVLQSVNDWNNCRSDIIFEIRHLIHRIRLRGIDVSFCWVPSHCGIQGNEIADRKAKDGANKWDDSVLVSNIKLSKNEMYSLLKKVVHKQINFVSPPVDIKCSRNIQIIINKLRINSWNTKFTKDVTCLCNKKLSIKHILLECPVFKQSFQEKNIFISSDNLEEILLNNRIFDIAKIIYDSSLNKLL